MSQLFEKNKNELHNEIIHKLSISYVDCPDCKYMEDDQYTCTTCWNEGGNGLVNVLEYLKQNINQ